MKVPSCVLWALTKKNSAFIRQQKGAKSRKECFSSDPLNLTNLHNASAQGYTNANSVGLQAEKTPSKKNFRRDYLLKVNHKQYNKTNRVLTSKDGSARLTASSIRIKRGTAHTAKVVKGLTFVNEAKKTLLLKRLAKLHGATRDQLGVTGKK
mmetsp:Transcript_17251/g.29056  ORF Transcript_17251/g.29056 Transcript_17251/m.29056 type:complete len:152 (-) Transcript_17251:265-720(-)